MNESPRDELPDFAKLWDFNDPAATERKFRDLLPAATAAGDTGYHAELLTQIARAQGLQREFDSAHATLDEVKELIASGRCNARARVRCLLERGRAFNSANDPETARPLFVEAWEIATDAGEDSLAIDAAHMVAIVEAKSPEKALEWNLKALRLAEASDQKRSKQWLGSLYNNIGWTYFDQKEYDEALQIFEKALVWRETKEQLQPILIARWCIGRVFRALGRVEEALARQQELAKAYERSDLEEDGYVAEELGECHLALDQRDAEQYFKAAYELLSKDSWLVENEPERIARLKQFGKVE